MAETYFRITNTVALLAWIALLIFPGRRWVSGWLCATLVPGALAASYAAVIGWRLLAGNDLPEDLTTLDGLRAGFSDDWVMAAAWTHYLAFDMVVGAWIARDAIRVGVPALARVPALALTFLLGPAGYLLYLVVRGTQGGGLRVDDGRTAPAASDTV